MDYDGWKIKVKKVMRYNDVGDWQDDKKEFSVYSGLNEKQRALVLVHEVVEAIACHLQGMTSKEVDECDRFGKLDKRYDTAHIIASSVERTLAELCGIDFWGHRLQIRKLKIKHKNWKE